MTTDAAISGLRGSELSVLQRLLGAAEQTPQRDAAVVLAATLVRGGEDAAVQELFQSAARWTVRRGSVALLEEQRRRCSAGRCRAAGAVGRRWTRR